MAVDQLRIVSINKASGVYQVRLNFDGNVKWTTTGSHLDLPSQQVLQKIGTFVSSRATEELANALGKLDLELADSPDVNNIIRECFEQAKADGYNVHALVGRYSNTNPPIFQEYVHAGTVDPREITVGHKRVPPNDRRTEVISCSFTPAKRLDVPLSQIDWQETDMLPTVRPAFLGIVGEPGYDSWTRRYRFAPKKLSRLILDGTIGTGRKYDDPGALTEELAFGIQPFSRNKEVDKLRDEPGVGPFPMGNWMIKLETVIHKLCNASNIVWDGVFPDGFNARFAKFKTGGNIYEDQGELGLQYVTLEWNYAFGVNPFDGSNFKGPATWDSEMFVRDVLPALAAQMKSRMDISSYDSDGLPILRFIAFGQSIGTFPDLEELPDSSEDAFVTDKDGVRVKRRGFEGTVLAPSNSKNPVEIEIPFAPFAIGYETAPCYDASRLTPNGALDFIDQWKCGFRGAISDGGGDDETVYPLNPDGWVLPSHLFYYDSDPDMTHFPASHDSPDGLYLDFESAYRVTKWQGYYPVHAIYETDRANLTEEQRKDRQKNYLISYALTYGRYIRGERRRLSRQFLGCVAPNWSDIANGQVYKFAPLTTLLDYNTVEIARDIDADVISVQFEEASPDTLPISYIIESDMKGAGGIGGQGKTDFGTGTPATTLDNRHIVKFYSGGASVKEIEMSIKQFVDVANNRVVALSGIPYPYDETGGEPYGQNAQYFFHYKGSESGNVEIVGLSPTGIADYWASSLNQYKHGSNPTNNTDVTYRMLLERWSPGRNNFIVERPLQAAAVKPRIYVAGRFTLDFNLVFTWLDFTPGGIWPFSNDDCKSNIDLGYLGTHASVALPTLTVVGNKVQITWANKYRTVTIMAQAWGFNPLDTDGTVTSGHDWQAGANPVENQTPIANACQIGFWFNNWAGAVGQRHVTKATLNAINGVFANPQLDLLVIEFWGELEIIGENA